ncbi:MAG: Na+/H+ antiporter subunit E [Gemmatimonadota bacterium]
MAFLALVWWILEPVPGSWMAGVVAVATGVGLRLYASRMSPVGIRPLRLARFGLYFAGQSVLGGWDVSRRALSPALPISPGVMTHQLSLPSSSARVFMSNALSLLPGTFAADLRDDVLTVHLLVGGERSESRVVELERRVDALFRSREE